MSKKLPKIKTLEKKLTKLCYEFVFKRDKNQCQKCGKVVTGQNRHPSHVIPKSRSKLLRWDDTNIKTMCYFHHMGWWHQNPFRAGLWFKEKFPDRSEYLDTLEHVKLKDFLKEEQLTEREWLEKQIDRYNNKEE